MRYEIKNKLQDGDEAAKVRFLTGYSRHYLDDKWTVPLPSLVASFDFPLAELAKQKVISAITFGSAYIDSLYRIIISNENGVVLEKVLMLHLLEDGKYLRDLQREVQTVSYFISSPAYVTELAQLKRKFTGQKAYNFALPDSNGKIVRLTDFKGKVVFVDFWYTGCSNCVSYYENELSKMEKRFEKDTNVVFVSICIDRNKRSWMNSIKSGRYTSPSAVNLYTGGHGTASEVIKFYGVYAYPQPLIIGRDQRIVKFSIDLRTADGIEKAIE